MLRTLRPTVATATLVAILAIVSRRGLSLDTTAPSLATPAPTLATPAPTMATPAPSFATPLPTMATQNSVYNVTSCDDVTCFVTDGAGCPADALAAPSCVDVCPGEDDQGAACDAQTDASIIESAFIEAVDGAIRFEATLRPGLVLEVFISPGPPAFVAYTIQDTMWTTVVLDAEGTLELNATTTAELVDLLDFLESVDVTTALDDGRRALSKLKCFFGLLSCAGGVAAAAGGCILTCNPPAAGATVGTACYLVCGGGVTAAVGNCGKEIIDQCLAKPMPAPVASPVASLPTPSDDEDEDEDDGGGGGSYVFRQRRLREDAVTGVEDYPKYYDPKHFLGDF